MFRDTAVRDAPIVARSPDGTDLPIGIGGGYGWWRGDERERARHGREYRFGDGCSESASAPELALSGHGRRRLSDADIAGACLDGRLDVGVDAGPGIHEERDPLDDLAGSPSRRPALTTNPVADASVRSSAARRHLQAGRSSSWRYCSAAVAWPSCEGSGASVGRRLGYT